MRLSEMNRDQLLAFKSDVEKEYNEFAARKLSLDMSRGKPCAQQLDLCNDMLAIPNTELMKTAAGMDTRNYGCLDGIPEAKALFAEILGVESDEIFIGGNSSLSLMFGTVARNMSHGVLGGKPWCQGKVKFLCPSPGYDRHFAICEFFGIEMIPVKMGENGPDMDFIEQMVSNDADVKGIWCVPMYSNPEGTTYSDETVKRFAALKPAAEDFRIFWDNAYCIHHLTDTPDTLLNIMDECKKNGNENMVYIYASTSKVSFPGSGIAALATSKENLAAIKKEVAVETIGYDKINQLRHVKYFENIEGVKAHMLKHRAILEPKFEAVDRALSQMNSELDICSWHKPNGGYFVSFHSMPGCAKRIWELCKNAGVVLTNAGATYPYGKDPLDSNIRIAPSFPPIDELETALELFCICVKLASAEKLLEQAK